MGRCEKLGKRDYDETVAEMQEVLTAGHTPTPWKVEALSVFGPHDEKGALAPVACCDVRWDGLVIRPYAEVVGNTAFIIRACNAHDELVAALDCAEGFIEEVHGEVTQPRFTDRAGWGDQSEELLVAIRAALTKAGAWLPC